MGLIRESPKPPKLCVRRHFALETRKVKLISEQIFRNGIDCCKSQQGRVSPTLAGDDRFWFLQEALDLARQGINVMKIEDNGRESKMGPY